MVLVVGAAACGGGAIEGKRVRLHVEPGPPVARSSTFEEGGVRVLWNLWRDDRSDGRVLMAGDAAQLRALWREIGIGDNPPPVRFDTHVVLGAARFRDCQEVVGVDVDQHGTVSLQIRELFLDGCELDVAIATATVTAVPRAVLPPRFVWKDHVFVLPPAGAHGPAVARRASLEREAIANPRGIVTLPAPGYLGMRAVGPELDVWVINRADGTVSVVLGHGADLATYGTGAAQWDVTIGRFSSGHDSAGRNVDGGPPLTTFAFARLDGRRIAVGDMEAAPDGPIEARNASPKVEPGSASRD